MASSLRDAICSLLILYIVFIIITIACSMLVRQSVTSVTIFLETIFLGLSIAKTVRRERHIDSLGARASLVRGWLPFNIDFVVSLIWYEMLPSILEQGSH